MIGTPNEINNHGDITIEINNTPTEQPTSDGTDGGRAKKGLWSKVFSSRAESKKDESFASKKTAAEGVFTATISFQCLSLMFFLFLLLLLQE